MNTHQSLVTVLIVLLLLVAVPVSSNLLQYDIFDLNYPDPVGNQRRQAMVQLDVFSTPYAQLAKIVCDSLIADDLRKDYHYHYCMSGMIQSLRWRSIFALSDTCYLTDGKHDDFIYALTMLLEMENTEKDLSACIIGEPAAHLIVPVIMSPHIQNIHLLVIQDVASPDEDIDIINVETVTKRWNLSVAERLSISSRKPLILSSYRPILEPAGGRVDALTGEVIPISIRRRIVMPQSFQGICDVVIINEESFVDKNDQWKRDREEDLHRQVVEVVASATQEFSEEEYSGLSAIDMPRRKKTTRIIQLKSGIDHDRHMDLMTKSKGSVDWILSTKWFDKSYFYHHNDSNGFVARTYGLPSSIDNITLSTAHIGVINHHYPVDTNTVKRCPFNNPKLQLFIVISYNLRVFAETAFGLQNQLKGSIKDNQGLGYRHVLVVHDFSLHSMSYIQPMMDKVCGSQLLHISLDPHDIQVFGKHFIAFHMEQPWSNITFGWGAYRYAHVLSKAMRIWSFSPYQVDLFSNAKLNQEFTSRYSDINLMIPLFDRSKIDYVPLYTIDPNRRRNALRPYARDEDGNKVPGTHDLASNEVLFFGSGSPRRAPMLHTLIQRFDEEGKVSFRIFTGTWNITVFDLDRDMVVHTAKVVFNINTAEDSVLEAHRLNYLLSMGKCVVSERGIDPALVQRYDGAIVFVDSLDELFEKIIFYVKHDKERKHIEKLALQRHFELQQDRIDLVRAMNNVVSDLKKMHGVQ